MKTISPVGKWSAPDEHAARLLLPAHRAAERGQRLAADSLLRVLLARLIGAYGNRRSPARAAEAGSGAAARAREMLHASWTDPPDLQELPAAAGITPFALLRSFRRAYGLPPHAYVVQLRVRQARKLLEGGMPPAQTAVATGFCDQSHLSRHFRRIVGATPGCTREASAPPLLDDPAEARAQPVLEPMGTIPAAIRPAAAYGSAWRRRRRIT
ncbi:helix-turn-helix domain-containing protein [Nonomuraea sp. NPDC005501]|uniref:helix-turn-helix domain-containing protein n=1 Tax=Nonomuraea sp. NPDC005501 TaxID=3156884 RepID=UPI0033AD7681